MGAAVVARRPGLYAARRYAGHLAAGPAGALSETLIETVESLGERRIDLYSLTDSSDTTTSSGKLIFHIFGALAEFERAIIRERTRAGLDAARARGRTGGRPPSLVETDRAAVKALLRNPDIPVEEVAKRLCIAPSTLYQHFPGGRAAVMQDT